MSNFILNIYLFLLLWRYRGYFFSDKGHRSYWPPYVLDFFFVLFKKKTKRLFQNTVPLHIFLNINITERDRNCVKCLVCVCVCIYANLQSCGYLYFKYVCQCQWMIFCACLQYIYMAVMHVCNICVYIFVMYIYLCVY